MKILYLTVNRSMRVAYHYVRLQQAIAKIADVEFIEKSHVGMPLIQAVHQLDKGMRKDNKVLDPQYANQFDVIFTDSMYFFWNEEWENVKVPTCQMIEEVNGTLWQKQIQTSNNKKIDLLVYRYKDAFNSRAMPLLKHGKTFWLPHGIDTDICKDYGEPKTNDAVHFGEVTKSYPIRQAIIKQLGNKSYFRRIVRPKDNFKHTKKWPIKHDYARLINQSKICLTCGTKFRYPVMKYLETMGCNTLLIAAYFPELKDMGIKDGTHMIAIDTNNIAKQVEYWLQNETERKQIAQQGIDFVSRQHNMDVRARELVDFLQGEI